MTHARAFLAAIALSALGAPAALAHHSAAMFDFTRSEQMSGVVKSFELINPHMRLVMVVSDAKGTRDVEFEGHSLNNMYRAGWRPNMVKVGDRLTVIIAPRKDGGDGGYVTAAITASGTRFGVPSRGEQVKAEAEAKP
jgi:hypothetical protein